MDLSHTRLLRKKDINAMLATYHSPLKKELKTFDLRTCLISFEHHNQIS